MIGANGKLRPFVLTMTTIVSVLCTFESDMADLAGLCPYSNYCTSSSNSNLPEPSIRPCCGSCSCHEDCWTIGSCCPDFYWHNLNVADGSIGRPPVISCKSQHVLFNEPRGFLDLKQQTPDYRIIDTCLKDTEDLSCSANNSLEDYVIVSDVDDEFVFRNKKCAKCNGYANVISWDLIVYCQDLFNTRLSSITERDQFIMSQCHVQSEPPNPEIGVKSICLKSTVMFDTCNRSNERRIYDQEIDKMCRSFQQIYFPAGSPERKLSIVYKNIYCYLCNSNDKPTTDVCLASELGKIVKSTNLKISFSAIIGASSAVSEKTTRLCPFNAVHDKYVKPTVCRRLLCPPGTYPSGGDCRNTGLETKGLPIVIVISMTTSDSLAAAIRSADANNAMILIRTFKNVILNMFDIDSINCGICYIFIIDGSDDVSTNIRRSTVNDTENNKDSNNSRFNRFFISTMVYSTLNCTQITLIKRLMAGLNQDRHKTILLFGKEENVRFKSLHTSEVDGRRHNSVLHVFHIDKCVSSVELHTVVSQTDCPRLEVQRNILIGKGANLSDIPDQSFARDFTLNNIVANQDDSDSVLVCMEFYFSLFSTSATCSVPMYAMYVGVVTFYDIMEFIVSG